jgi:hypothetical protein
MNDESYEALESRTLQLSLAPEKTPPLFSLPHTLAHTLMLHPSKHYTIGVILTAFHTYILNHSLALRGGLLKPCKLFPHTLAPAGNATHIPYSAALKNLCQQLKPA